jgi:4,5-DOPA dioxygenase extradiol
MMEWGGVHYEWAAVFSNAIKDAIITHNFDAVVNYNELTGAKESVPTQEHFIPLIYILGLYTGSDTVGIFANGIEFGSISMTSLFIQEKLQS